MTRSKFIGSLIGLAVGDSLGANYEGDFSVDSISDDLSRYTDDTVMMIGIVESIIECRGLNGENIAKKYVKNFEEEPWRGYGSGPPRIFRMIKNGGKWNEKLDRKFFPGGSFGNGSAMRVAPIGLLYREDPVKLRKASYIASMITHSHPLAMEGAALEAYAVALAYKEEKDIIDKLIGFTKIKSYHEKLDTMKILIDREPNKKEIAYELGNGIEAINSVPAAIYSFATSSSFEDSLRYAINLGGDTDTIAAMCGAIAGARWGVEKIPSKWKAQLENREYIENLGNKLWEIVKSRKNQETYIQQPS